MTRKLVIRIEFERFYSDRQSLERSFSYVVFVFVVSIGCYNNITVNFLHLESLQVIHGTSCVLG